MACPAAANGPINMIFCMRGVPLHVYYIQFGQYTHPMGSGRPHGQLASTE